MHLLASTNTFLGERYRRLAKRRGSRRALVAVARSMLVIIWHLLSGPYARFTDLGSDYHQHRVDKDRRARDLVRQLQALGATSLPSAQRHKAPNRDYVPSGALPRPFPRAHRAPEPTLFSEQKGFVPQPHGSSYFPAFY